MGLFGLTGGFARSENGNGSGKASAKRSGKEAKPHVLHTLKASDKGDRTADFGSIRFPGSRRPVPSKYVRVACRTAETNDSMAELIPLFIETWGLPPPCAIISVVSADSTMPDNPQELFQTRPHLVFARGIADAAARTNAWVVTDGLADGVASLVGRALRDSDRPLLGIAPWKVRVPCPHSGASASRGSHPRLANGPCCP